jgi:hypothetical protein
VCSVRPSLWIFVAKLARSVEPGVGSAVGRGGLVGRDVSGYLDVLRTEGSGGGRGRWGREAHRQLGPGLGHTEIRAVRRRKGNEEIIRLPMARGERGVAGPPLAAGCACASASSSSWRTEARSECVRCCRCAALRCCAVLRAKGIAVAVALAPPKKKRFSSDPHSPTPLTSDTTDTDNRFYFYLLPFAAKTKTFPLRPTPHRQPLLPLFSPRLASWAPSRGPGVDFMAERGAQGWVECEDRLPYHNDSSWGLPKTQAKMSIAGLWVAIW